MSEVLIFLIIMRALDSNIRYSSSGSINIIIIYKIKKIDLISIIILSVLFFFLLILFIQMSHYRFVCIFFKIN